MIGAGGENRTPNLLITNQLPYHWATPAKLGYGGGNRTPILGFGGPDNAIILHRINWRSVAGSNRWPPP